MKFRALLSIGVGWVLILVWFSGAAATEVATICVPNLNVRSGPDEQFDVVFRLVKQTQVRVIGRKKDWLEIDHNGRTGFIANKRRFVTLTTIAEFDSPSHEGSVIYSDPQQGNLKDLSQTAETVREKLEVSRNELDEVSQKERTVLNEINSAEKALDEARRQVRMARSEVATLQEKVTLMEQKYDALEKEIETGQAYAAQRLVALYKLNWIGRLQLLATAESFFDFINRKSALECILAQDEAVLEKLQNDQSALEITLEQLNTSKAEKRASELVLDERIKTLSAEQIRRTALLDKIRSKKALKRAALKALQQAAKELDSTIAQLGSEPPVEKVMVVAPSQTQNKPFKAYKGLLSWPVKGRIISFFGPYRDKKTDVVNFQSGIMIKAERGEPIRAVAAGNTIFAGWFKGYGNMMIIDHGNHFYTVYAHLEEIFKVKGDHVDQSEVIATVGDTGSLIGPALHFEVRHHGNPVNPLEWINRG